MDTAIIKDSETGVSIVNVFLDTNPIINVLCKEVEPETDKPLWLAPKEILNLISDKKIVGMTSILNIMEIRSVLSMKKAWKKEKILECENEIKKDIQMVIPEFLDHLEADSIQRALWLTPTDSLILALSRKENAVLITRDKALKGSGIMTHEKFLEWLQGLRLKPIVK